MGPGRRRDGAHGGAAGTDGVEIRRIETFEDHLAGLEIMLASDAFSQEAMARSGRRRGRHSSGACAAAGCSGSPSSTARRSRSRSPSGARSACSSPAARRCPRRAAAGAIGRSSGRAGTRPWRSACPGLAVQAQYGSSAPILRRLGFVETATVHTLRSPAIRLLTPERKEAPADTGAPLLFARGLGLDVVVEVAVRGTAGAVVAPTSLW